MRNRQHFEEKHDDDMAGQNPQKTLNSTGVSDDKWPKFRTFQHEVVPHAVPRKTLDGSPCKTRPASAVPKPEHLQNPYRTPATLHVKYMAWSCRAVFVSRRHV